MMKYCHNFERKLNLRHKFVQYHGKATDTVCSIKLKREEFLNYKLEQFSIFRLNVFLYKTLLFYQISAWVFLIHMFLYQGSYPYSETNFQDFSRTFPGHRMIFQGLLNSH